MQEHEIPLVTALDETGREHHFKLTSSALRRANSRSKGLATDNVEGMFLILWESRVDKSEPDEETYFERFHHPVLIKTAERLLTEHQGDDRPNANPKKPKPKLTEMAGSGSTRSA